MQISLAWYSVTDLDRAKDFYGATLGLKKTFEMPGWTEFSHAEDAVSVGLALAKDAPNPSGGATVVFRVPDVDQARKNLETKGVRFEGEVEEIPGAVRIATFRDPFENRLQLVQVLLSK
jgi:predicted enzyme related to lactoylglutathione lyase